MRMSRLAGEIAITAAVLAFAGLAARACGQTLSLVRATASAQDTGSAEANRPAPVLLELFTSEGCSSCPPADALLKELDRRQTPAGQLLIGLSEHVTYWNNLGWTDPFSSDLYTARQNSYSERFNLDSVYTPQLVINGAEQVVGSDRQGLARALRVEQQRGQAALHIDEVRRVPEGLAVTYTLSALPNGSHARMFAALADDIDRSSVQRGENGGRTLTHAAVVRSLMQVGPAEEANHREIMVRLPTAARTAGMRQHLVMFAQEANFGQVVGVAEQPLAQP